MKTTVAVGGGEERGEGLVLDRNRGWGFRLWAHLPCGHTVELLTPWIAQDGTLKGGLGCSSCRRRYDSVQLKAWGS